MRIVKFIRKSGNEVFAEVIKQGPVQFDDRNDWLLLGIPAGHRLAHQEVLWIHPSDEGIIWDREFTLF